MASSITTTTGALNANDPQVYLASLTGITNGALLVCDKEVLKVGIVPSSASLPVPVMRGQEGTAAAAHPNGAQVKFGVLPSALLAGDYPQAPAGAASLAMLPASPSREVVSYSASGAIQMPRPGSDMVAILNGTVALAMTVGNPNTMADGSRLTIIGNGKAAHTVTYGAGLGNVGGTADVITFAAAQAQGIELMAIGSYWVGLGMNTAVAGAGATINGVGLG